MSIFTGRYTVRTMTPLLLTAETAAKELLGYVLVHQNPAGILSGKIVETEAYDERDPASHTFRGPTKRNQPMFGPAGTIYIYFTYGMHYCLNIVAGAVGQGEAVLIRALEPMEGIEQMRVNRGNRPDHELTNGPAKLVQALGVSPNLNGAMLGNELRLVPTASPVKIIQTTRIGTQQAKETPWRFYVADSPFVSRR